VIESFLRRPRGALEIAADAVRLIGVACLIAMPFGWRPVDFAVFALVLPALLAPRFIRMRPGADILSGVVLIVAGWSAVLQLYTSVVGWDLLIHFVCTGVLALLGYLALDRVGVLPRADERGGRHVAVVGLTTALGLALSAVWEVVEWVAHTYIDPAVFVNYTDTIGDMAFGGLGSLLAGVLARYARAPLSSSSHDAGSRAEAPASHAH